MKYNDNSASFNLKKKEEEEEGVISNRNLIICNLRSNKVKLLTLYN